VPVAPHPDQTPDPEPVDEDVLADEKVGPHGIRHAERRMPASSPSETMSANRSST